MKKHYRYTKDSLYLLFAILCLPFYALGQNNFEVFKATPQQRPDLALKTKFRSFNLVTIESDKIFNYVRLARPINIHLIIDESKDWQLELQPCNITSPDYSIGLFTGGGMKTITSKPDYLFKGKVKGSTKDEDVRLTIKEGYLCGYIACSGRQYFIEPVSNVTHKKSNDEYIVYEAKDIIQSGQYRCGNINQESQLQTTFTPQTGLKEETPLGSICRKVNFITIADYSIYQKFNNDVEALETALLTNLNMAQGAYTTLNLGTDGSTDVGSDYLQFQVRHLIVSTCANCDILQNTESTTSMWLQLMNWIKINYPNNSATLFQVWTTRSLFDFDGKELVGIAFNYLQCSSAYGAGQFLKYHSDDPAFLRQLTAHEIGHLLGCRHDDEVDPNITGFIMNSYIANPTMARRFSTIADFGGGTYSSLRTMRNLILRNSCLEACQTTSCDDVKNIKINYFNSADSVKISWTGSGTFLTRCKESDSSFYSTDNILETTNNSIVLKNLKPCTLYSIDVQKKCTDTEVGRASAIDFAISSMKVSAKPINVRGSLYDLELSINCLECSNKADYISIDRRIVVVESEHPSRFVISDLFSDGAVHKVEVLRDSTNKICKVTTFYKAPYYRNSSKPLLVADFNDCVFPVGWKDSLVAKATTTVADAHWSVGSKNSFSRGTERGNFDSTCMLYFNRQTTNTSGAVCLISPTIDLTGYKDLKLHFDYNFQSLLYTSAIYASFAVDVFDGNNWVNVFKRSSDNYQAQGGYVWDSIPKRVFVDLDKYKNKDFKLRFVADDGSFAFNSSYYLFTALDNIVVDGYLENDLRNDFVVFPNPTQENVFIRLQRSPSDNLKYRLLDMSGRLVKQGSLISSRISTLGLPGGVYFLELYMNDSLFGREKILKLE